jgi:prepilin peptidase CpaA
MNAYHVPLLVTQTLIGVGCLCLCGAALHDAASRTIPNCTAAAVAIIGVVLRVLDGRLVAGLAASATVFALAAILWQRGWVGGGDVKLLGAAALAVPPGQVANMVLVMALVGGVLSLLYLALPFVVPAPAAQRPKRRLSRVLRTEQWRIRRRGPLPYGAAIAAAAVINLLGASS